MLFRISYPDSVLDTIAGPGQFYAAAWSPDGRIIACVLRAGEVGIYLLDSVGNDYHRIIPYSDFPSWAYSDSIIYTSYEEGFPFGSICISDTGGIYKRLIIDNGVYEFPNMTYVKFNRITGRIIFNSRDRYPDMGLWGMEPNQDTIRLILRGCDEADFSPDGNQIVFTRISAGFGNLWIINWDGTGLRILTP
jgi:Tol biopolymer transport system component